jgi:hypothetical protein
VRKSEIDDLSLDLARRLDSTRSTPGECFKLCDKDLL